MSWKLLKKGELFAAVMNRSGGICECRLDHERRCSRKLVDVVTHEDGTVQGMCRVCRLIGLGVHPTEKRAQTKAFKAAQVEMPLPEPEQKDYKKI